jgi:hypothetical protein
VVQAERGHDQAAGSIADWQMVEVRAEYGCGRRCALAGGDEHLLRQVHPYHGVGRRSNSSSRSYWLPT